MHTYLPLAIIKYSRKEMTDMRKFYIDPRYYSDFTQQQLDARRRRAEEFLKKEFVTQKIRYEENKNKKRFSA
jgi:hypothetical protein